jgi:hypothetical protein
MMMMTTTTNAVVVVMVMSIVNIQHTYKTLFTSSRFDYMQACLSECLNERS